MYYMDKLLQKVKETQDEFIFQTISPYCEEIAQRELSKKDLVNALVRYRELEEENEILKKRVEELEYNLETDYGKYIYYWQDWHGEEWSCKILRELKDDKVEIHVRDLGVEIILPKNELIPIYNKGE